MGQGSEPRAPGEAGGRREAEREAASLVSPQGTWQPVIKCSLGCELVGPGKITTGGVVGMGGAGSISVWTREPLHFIIREEGRGWGSSRAETCHPGAQPFSAAAKVLWASLDAGMELRGPES